MSDLRLSGSHINYLDQEELSHELEIRGVASGTVRLMRQRLRELLRLEKGDSVDRTGTPEEYAEEYAIIVNKLKIIGERVDAFEGRESDRRAIVAVLAHLWGRIQRLNCNELALRTADKNKLAAKLLDYKLALSQSGNDNHTPALSPLQFQLSAINSTALRVDEGEVVSDDAASISDSSDVPLITKIKTKDIISWGVKFDGSSDIRTFLNEIKEYQLAHHVADDQLFRCAYFFFSGHAKTWFQANRAFLKNWKSLCQGLLEEFSSPDYNDRLWDKIRNRKQGEGEPVGYFLSSMCTMFMQLSMEVPENLKTDIIRRNLNSKYQLALALFTITSFDQLTKYCKTLERTHEELNTQSRSRGGPSEPKSAYRAQTPRLHTVRDADPQPSTSQTESLSWRNTNRSSSPPSSSNNLDSRRKTISIKCWKCNLVGHRAVDCKKVEGIACYKCQNPGFTIRNCPKCNPSTSEN